MYVVNFAESHLCLFHVVDGKLLRTYKNGVSKIDGYLEDYSYFTNALLDVFEIEPIQPDNPLIGLPNCILTSHVAGVASDTTARIWNWAHDNVRAVVQRAERPRWIRNGV